MPELPEAEICRRNLTRWLAGRGVVAAVAHDPAVVRAALSTSAAAADPAGPARVARRLNGATVRGVLRHGKRLGLDVEGGGVLIHLGMTGRWVRREVAGGPVRAGRLELRLDDGSALWFVDPRRFGGVVAVGDVVEAVAAGLGPDALDAPPDGPDLARRLGRFAAIKPRLMEQQRLAGLGNIQAVEALFAAGIHPAAGSSLLDARAWASLAAAIPVTLAHAVASTEAEEVAYLSDGSHVPNPFAVYGRAGRPCGRCGASLLTGRQGGRSTAWCPGCQRVGAPGSRAST